jgi:hypothetical protein
VRRFERTVDISPADAAQGTAYWLSHAVFGMLSSLLMLKLKPGNLD